MFVRGGHSESFSTVYDAAKDDLPVEHSRRIALVQRIRSEAPPSDVLQHSHRYVFDRYKNVTP